MALGAWYWHPPSHPSLAVPAQQLHVQPVADVKLGRGGLGKNFPLFVLLNIIIIKEIVVFTHRAPHYWSGH